MTKYFIFFLLLIESCSGQNKTFKVLNSEMESTVSKNSTVTYKQKQNLERGDIVVMHYFDKRLQKQYSHILRVVGLPGDTVTIYNGNILVNDKEFVLPTSSRFSYMAYIANPSRANELNKYSSRRFTSNYLILFLDQMELAEIQKNKSVDSISRLVSDSSMVEKDIVTGPFSKFSNGYFVGPILIPKIGDQIDDAILSVTPNFLSKSSKTKKITENYYYLIGDNFLNCYDSRNFGIIPSSSINGVVSKISK